MLTATDQHCLFYEGSSIVSHIREYIIGIVAAAILCSLVIQLTKGNSTNAAIVKTACGIIMTMCVISPLIQFKLDTLSLPDLESFLEGEAYAAVGYETSIDKISEVIKQRSEAYVLEKASYFDCDLEVQVTLNGENPPMPTGITVIGNVSPVTKQRLQSIIEKDLGIPMEWQIWN